MIALTPELCLEPQPAALAPDEEAETLTKKNAVAAGRNLLRRAGRRDPVVRYDLEEEVETEVLRDATATALMDHYRRGRPSEAFEALVDVVGPVLQRRVSRRIRGLGASLDVQEVLQDVIINVYRYPDRFDGRKPGAFRAWSSRIVDNTIRRKLRRTKQSTAVQLQPIDLLVQAADARGREPLARAQANEQCGLACSAMSTFLLFYLNAFSSLSDRERFVLQMVEVRGMRYAELSTVLGIRPEALKMVVFRARRRITSRISASFERALS